MWIIYVKKGSGYLLTTSLIYFKDYFVLNKFLVYVIKTLLNAYKRI
jgi:hypothetical protein